MANMRYCRFQNTLADLEDCKEALENEDMNKLSPEENYAKEMLVELCKEIAEEY